jgi:ribosomal protein L12E/L44/L45/RPP1/RPP2
VLLGSVRCNEAMKNHFRSGIVCRLALAGVIGACLIAVPWAGAAERVFQGVDYSKVREVKDHSYGAMPEVYEFDATTGRYRSVETTLQVQLDGTWVTYNPTLNMYYLNKVPGEAEGSYFGPIEGDPFEAFKLEELYTARLRKDYAPDEQYRLRLMLRSGNAKLRERALRIVLAALGAEVKFSARSANVSEFRRAVEEHEGADLEPVLAAIKATEKAIEEATPTYPDEAYAPGNEALEKQGKFKDWMKLPGAVPEGAWGEPLNGLRAAAVFSTVTPEAGAKMDVWLVVENVSDHPIKFALHDVIQMARPSVQRADGTEVAVKSSFFTGLTPIHRHRLQPKERLTLTKKTLEFDEKAENPGFGENRAAAGAGEYQVQYREVMGNGTAKGEWGGQLTTGETKITVVAKKP